MSRGWRILTVALVTVMVLGAMVAGAIRGGLTAEGMVFALGTLSLLVTGVLLVLKVPENRLSWVMLLVALGDGLMNAADGSEPGSLLEIAGGIALFALVLPGLGVFVPLWFPTGRVLTPRSALGLGRGDGGRDRARRRLGDSRPGGRRLG